MRVSLYRLILGAFLFAATSALAAVRYVDLNSSTPASPYTSWATAATNIQDAIDAALSGDQILVTNGVYRAGGRAISTGPTNRAALYLPVTVESVNGPSLTVIEGFQQVIGTNGPSAVRCAYLTNGAALIGFTLTKGATISNSPTFIDGFGGGVWCESTNAFVSNCVLRANAAWLGGGGAFRGTLANCSVTGNTLLAPDNSVAGGPQVPRGGGGYSSVLNNCVVADNSAQYGGGAYMSTINNSVVTRNRVAGPTFGSAGGGASASTLNNCTVTDNSAAPSLNGNNAGSGGGLSGASIANNCIVYYNSGSSGSNYFGGTFTNSCTSPLPSGANNITNDPAFVDIAATNLHLQATSPCINSGNNTYATSPTDLDGNPRIAGGTVDMGAYEFQSPVSTISYAWLQQFGLTIDSSVDQTDTDTDGMSNWQEWRAGTVPIDTSSLLLMFAPATNAPGLLVSWKSVTNRTYFLQRSTNLQTQPPFSSLKSNLIGLPSTTTYADTNAVAPGPYFYRVGVQ